MTDPMGTSGYEAPLSEALMTLLSKARTYQDTHDGTGMLLYRAEANFQRIEDSDARDARRWW